MTSTRVSTVRRASEMSPASGCARAERRRNPRTGMDKLALLPAATQVHGRAEIGALTPSAAKRAPGKDIASQDKAPRPETRWSPLTSPYGHEITWHDVVTRRCKPMPCPRKTLSRCSQILLPKAREKERRLFGTPATGAKATARLQTERRPAAKNLSNLHADGPHRRRRRPDVRRDARAAHVKSL